MYHFTVPAAKHLRVIVDTDCKNEADDQFCADASFDDAAV